MVLQDFFRKAIREVKWGGFRRFLCTRIFKKAGKNINVERMAWFGSGIDIKIGDNSGIGINAHIPNGTIIETT